MDIAIERFITEIESRPAIWDMNSPQYSDRIQKIKQWEEVIGLFTDQGISDIDKKQKGRLLQGKWKNLRDAFMKECRKQTRSKTEIIAPSRTNKYRFYNQLLFLKPYAANNDTTNSTISDEFDNQTNETGRETHIDITPRKKRKKTIRNYHTEGISRNSDDALKSSPNQTETRNEDPDRLFMLSLVSDFKKVPDRLKSVVKMNLLKCIMEAQDGI